MKTFILFLHFLLSSYTLIGQQSITGKIENPASDKPSMDIVLFMFGMEHPVKVGETDNDGNLSISFPRELPASITSETKELFATQLPYALHFPCGNRSDFPESINNIIVYKGGYFSLSHSEQLWEGTLFPALNEELISWWQDPHYVNPVTSSFFEVIYCEQDVGLSTTCNNNLLYEEKEVVAEYKYDLKLKKGFNLIEYKIEATQDSGSSDIPAIPSIVTIVNAGDTNSIQWYAKYYY